MLAEVGVAGVVDILLMAALAYGVLAWMRAHHMRRMVRGVLVILVLYLVARVVDLELTTTALEATLVVTLVASIVLYGGEIRRLIERMAPFGQRGRRRAAQPIHDELARVVFDLAERRVGALVVLVGHDDLGGVVTGGTELDGAWSEPLTWSIFHPATMGHDGALILQGGQVWRFACHLPLSKDHDALGNHRGTRHAAALGISQATDALSVAVSEERGTVTVGEGGRLEEIDSVTVLADRFEAFAAAKAPPARRFRGPRILPSTALSALAVSALAWLVLVHGARPMEREYTAKVDVAGLAPDLRVQAVHPPEVVVRVTGAGRDFAMAGDRAVSVTLGLRDLRAGQHAVSVRRADVQLPRGLSVVDVEPERVSISVVPR